jgi:hypothetical protein
MGKNILNSANVNKTWIEKRRKRKKNKANGITGIRFSPVDVLPHYD